MRREIADKLIADTSAPVSGGTRGIGVRWVLEYLAWLFVIALLSGIFTLAVLSPAFARISATIKASNEPGFARMVIGFSDLPEFRYEVASGILVLSFDEPVDIDPSSVPEDIPGYVGLVRRDPDGRAIRFALEQPFQVNIMEAGTELFVDLLSPSWKGLPPPLPAATIKALTEKAIAAERRAADEAAQREAAKVPYKLDVRLARHPTFSRIVFDWNKFVTANLSRSGRTVELEFNQGVEADLSRLRVDPPKFLHRASAVKRRGGMVVKLTVDDDVEVRGFREGLTYVVDLTGPDALAEASADALARKVGAGRAEGRKSAVPEGAEEMAVLPGEQKASAAGKKRTRVLVSVETRDIDPADLSGRSFADEKADKPDLSGADRVRGTDAEGNASGETPRAAVEQDGEAAAAPPTAAKTDTAGPVAVDGHGVMLDTGKAGLRVSFQFEEPVAAAVFRRGHSVWAVFDSPEPLGLQGLQERASGMVQDIKHVRFGNAQYVRIKLKEPHLAHVEYADNGWHLSIGDMATGETTPLHLVRALRDDRRSLIKIAMKDYGRVHWLTDPEIGDRLAVVTAMPPQRNIPKPQELVDFSAFATAHGIAIRPRTDDVAVRLHLDEVLITRREGLTLSAGNVSQYVAGKKPLRKSARNGFIDFQTWRIAEPKELSDRIHELQRKVAVAPQDKMNARRFDLATLYAANGFYPESLGLLRRMAEVDKEVETDPAYNTLRGATLASMGRLDAARKDFAVHALADDADAALWRGLIASKDRQWEEALRRFEYGADALDAYPADIKARFRLAAARAALGLKKLSRAAEELNAVPREGLPGKQIATFQLLKGRYLESIGRSEEARDAYNLALESGAPAAKAEARLYATLLDLDAGRIDRKKALSELESLQLFWRGDDIELRTVRALADLYVKEKRYQDAFAMMSDAVRAFPKQKLALQIQHDMKEVFKSLFLNGGSEEMDPVAALSLFYGHRELTPVGRLGDEMIRRLSDRLVEVDLLDQAAELLDHQVNKRLKGAARAQVATRLSMVHLMNHKPELALRTLRQTRQAGLPEQLHDKRNLLEARALGELGRAAAAVEILNTMNGEVVEKLKADAYWAAQEWKEAGFQFEKLLAGRWSESEPLTKEERFNVLRAAVSYSLADDQFALDRLRKKFYPKLVKTPDAASFLLVTKPIKEKGVAFRDLAKEIAAVDTLDAFIEEFQAGYDAPEIKQGASAKPGTGNAG